MSLPGGIWDGYGELGWGPDGNSSFMEYDYTTVTRRCARRCCETDGGKLKKEEEIVGCVNRKKIHIPRRAEDLFEENICNWVQYYLNEKILRDVEQIYHTDYAMFGWYDIEKWIKKMNLCLESKTRNVLG